MKKDSCPRRQEMLARLILDDRTLPPTPEDVTHARECPACQRALKIAGALDQSLSDAFASARQDARPVPPGPALEEALRTLPAQPRWWPWIALVGLLVGAVAFTVFWAPAPPPPLPATPTPAPAAPALPLATPAPRQPASLPACHIVRGDFLDESGAHVRPVQGVSGKRLSCPGTGEIAGPGNIRLEVAGAILTVLDRGIALEEGSVDVEVPTRGTRFAVRTRLGTVSVTGTRFHVAFAATDQLDVRCMQGSVHVESLTGSSVSLNAGEEACLTPVGIRHAESADTPSQPASGTASEQASDSAAIEIEEEFSSDLRLAIKKGSFERVRELVASLTNVNIRDQRSWTPLHEAAYRGRPDVIALLLERGADPNIQTDDGWTALAEAAYMGYIEAARTLLDHGGSIDPQDTLGWTPLFRAAQGNQAEMVTFLLDRGAAVTAVDSHSATVLHKCAEGNQARPAGVLLAAGADPAAPDREGVTPLHIAARTGSVAVARLLLTAKAPPNARDRLENTPLHEAASHGFVSMVELLASCGADIDPPNLNGHTPLRLAVMNGEDDVEAKLLSLGAQPR